MEIRDAQYRDLPEILVIHNDAVVNTTAIWDDDIVDLADRTKWLDDRRTAGFPVLVAVIDGEVAGYASYSTWRARSGYRHTVENSVYVAQNHQRQGVAAELMPALIERARTAGIHVIVASIESANYGSIALHEKFGFRTVAEMPEVGVKFGRWLDMTYMQLVIPGSPPA